MNIKLFKLCCKSLKRRWRQIARACTATFLAVFFVTGVLLFEENMYQWQRACNKERFGDWFVMEITRGGKPVGLKSHPYIENEYMASSEVLLYDDNFISINGHLGYMEPGFIKSGNIVVEQGRMPKNDKEIAMDYHTLLEMGYGFELNQTITVHYYNGLSKEENKAQKEYKLVGVLRNYTNSWVNGQNLPGALVTKEEAKSYNEVGENIYIYSIKDYVKTDDYRAVFNNIKNETGANLYYNESVYDYKPWGSSLIYNYMYILVMVIGIIILAYQIVVYNSSRRESKQKLKGMGASKSQVRCITLAENMLILIPCGVIAILVALVVGKAVCMTIENHMGIEFYRFNYEVILKSLLSVLISGVVVTVTNFISRICYGRNSNIKNSSSYKKKKTHAMDTQKVPKKLLSRKNLRLVVHKRLLKGNGVIANIFVRAFALFMCVVMSACICNVVTAYSEYQENNGLPDFVGYKQEDDNYAYKYTYFVDDWYNKTFGTGSTRLDKLMETEEDDIRKQWEEYLIKWKAYLDGECTYKEFNYLQYETWSNVSGNYCKKGSSNIVKGVDDSFISTVKSLPGINSVSLASFETERMWRWNGMSFEKMGLDKIGKPRQPIVTPSEFENRYLFATEYVEPTEEFYKRISKYMDKEYVDYEAFSRGEQVLIILNDNPYGEYDDTIKAGTLINYQYYDLPLYNGTNGLASQASPYYSKFSDAYIKKLCDSDESYKWSFERDGLRELYEKNKGMATISSKSSPVMTEEWYELNFMPCVNPTVAGVVKLDDDIREEFKDILVDYGYYTAIASAQMGKNACDRQEALMARFLGDYMTGDVKCEFKYNQLMVNYDIYSTFSATGNIVEAYCRQANFNYKSYEGEKITQRSKTINAVLQYGITLSAALVINVLVYTIIINNRIEGRKNRFKQYAGIGMDRKMLCHICMLEVVRESLWFIFTAPLIILVSYVIYRKNLKKLYKGTLT